MTSNVIDATERDAWASPHRHRHRQGGYVMSRYNTSCNDGQNYQVYRGERLNPDWSNLVSEHRNKAGAREAIRRYEARDAAKATAKAGSE